MESLAQRRRLRRVSLTLFLNRPFDTKAHDGQNTLFDVGRSMFDVRRSLVSISIRPAVFLTGGLADT